MDVIFEIIIKIAELLSNSDWQMGEEEIYDLLLSQGYRSEDIRDALIWIRDAGKEARCRLLCDAKVYEVLKESAVPEDKWELFMDLLLNFYEDAEITGEEISSFAEEFSKLTENRFAFTAPSSFKEN